MPYSSGQGGSYSTPYLKWTFKWLRSLPLNHIYLWLRWIGKLNGPRFWLATRLLHLWCFLDFCVIHWSLILFVTWIDVLPLTTVCGTGGDIRFCGQKQTLIPTLFLVLTTLILLFPILILVITFFVFH